jgi:hypothetical protein
MEQKFKQKISDYSAEFKNKIKDWLKDNDAEIRSSGKNTNDFLEFIFDYPSLMIDKNDFQKRTRTKNNIPNYERCCALRLNGERCTRKKRTGMEYCGTHIKGVPYGCIETKPMLETSKLDIWVEDINGINQWIDAKGSVYSTADITASVKNPRIISKWVKINGEYAIEKI